MNRRKSSAKKSRSKSTTRLNKYSAHAGICSRREAEMHIGLGVVKINNQIVTELGYQVKEGDVVHFDGKPVNFNNEEDALKTLEKKLTQKSIAKAKEAGAENVSVNIDREVKTAKIENRSVFVEARILVEASGRPRISKS